MKLTIKKYRKISVFTSCLFLFFFFCFTAKSQENKNISISGQVLQAKNLEVISMATISIKRTRMGSICDSLGVFHLQIQQNDTLVISALGYQTKEWPIPFIFNPEFPPFFTIKMDDVSYLLDDVDIYALGSWDEFKDDFLNTEVKEKNPINTDIKKQLKPFNTKKPNPVPAQYRPKREKLGVVQAIFAPTDFLYGKLSKKEKNKRKLSKRIKEEGKNKKISKKYNAQIVADATGLKGDDLLNFMGFCGKRIQVTENSTDYDVMKQILDLFQEYTTKEE